MARNPFWTWSLRLYKRPGVASACLALQDHAGVDVNLLLFGLWAGSRGMALKPATVKAAVRLSRSWSAAVVQPLRAVRRALKQPAQSSKPLQGFRRRVAALELQAEHLQQDELQALFGKTAATQGEPVMRAAGNVAAYFRHAGIQLTPRDWTALKAIVRAAF